MQVAKVVVDVPTNQTNHSFDYLVPPEMVGLIKKRYESLCTVWTKKGDGIRCQSCSGI